MTRQVLHDFWARFYFPGNATLYVVGDFDADGGLDAAEQLIKDTFGKLPPGQQPGSGAPGPLREQQMVSDTLMTLCWWSDCCIACIKPDVCYWLLLRAAPEQCCLQLAEILTSPFHLLCHLYVISDWKENTQNTLLMSQQICKALICYVGNVGAGAASCTA